MAYFDSTQSDSTARMADAAANQTYYGSLAKGNDASQAREDAKFAWQKIIDTANQTGKFNGQWNMPSDQYFANTFGSWMPEGPQAGQQTMAREGQTYGQQQGYGELYGQYYAPGTAPTQGQSTLAAQNQANQLGLSQGNITGYYTDPQGNRVQTLAGQNQQFSQGLANQQEARAAQGQGQSQAMSYLNLLSSLRGPADWAKYQQVLGSTPGGMRDLAAAAMGQYVPGGGATTGYQPQAVSLQSMMGDISGNPYSGQGGGQLQQPSVYQGGQGMYGQPQQQWGQQSYQVDPTQRQQSYGTGPMQTMYMDQLQQQQQYQQAAQQQYQQGGDQIGGGYTPPQGYAAASYGAAQQAQRGDQIGGGYTPPQGYAAASYGAAQQAQQQGYSLPQQQQQRGSSYGTGPMQTMYMDTPSSLSGQTWGSGIGVGQQQATPQQQQQGLGGGANTMGQLPAPNQIAAQSWKNLAPSQQQMLLGGYEAQGWDKNDVTALMNQSLPKYTGSQGVGSYRLQ